MNYQSSLKILAVALTVLSTGACKKAYLDHPTNSDVLKENVFADINQVSAFVSNIYTSRTDGFTYLNYAMLASATDEAKCSNLANAVLQLNNGSWSASINPDDRWSYYYNAIRSCNIYFANKDEIKTTNYGQPILALNDYKQPAEAIKQRSTGEVFFLRAFYYFELMKRYGGVPLVTKVYDVGDNFNLARNSLDETVQFISNDLDSAVNYLPADYDGQDNNFGRATQSIAMALKSRLLLYAASDLYNPTGSKAKWVAAAEANKAVMDLELFSLDEDGYNQVFLDKNNNEVIFALRTAPRNDLETAFNPVGYDLGGGGINPTQNLVDDYETADGKMISENGSGYNPQNPYINRDPRFYATINYNGASWKGRLVQTYNGGKDGPGMVNATLTGYYMAKFLDPELNLNLGQQSNRNWIFIRYAEILLNYAEAQNEASGPDASVYDAVNQVRERAGMPDLADGLNQAQMREKIRHERRIEFAFEDHRFWDVRRWKIGGQVFGTPVRGTSITLNANGTFTYTSTQVENRVFSDKMYWYPIPQSEMYNNDKMTQNSGW